MGGRWTSQVASWARGYTPAQWRVAFQVLVAVGVTVAIIAWEPVWNALTYGAASPELAVILLFLLAAPNQGATTLNAAFLVVALMLGGALSLAVSAAAWGAAGRVWTDNGWAKGLTFTFLGALVAAAINALRWRWELTSQLFLMTAAAFVFAGGVGSYYLDAFYWKSMFFTMASGSIAAGVTVIACWFIFPVPAAGQYRRLVAAALRALGAAVGALEALALAPVDPTTGRLAAATGGVDWATGDDRGLAPAVAPVRAALSQARAALLASRALHVPVHMEVDVYGGSPWRRFPSDNFIHLKICIRMAVATAGTLARPLKGGRLDMRLYARPPLRGALAGVLGGVRASAEATAAAVEGAAGWAQADAALAAMDAAWLAYLDAALAVTLGRGSGAEGNPPDSPDAPAGADAVFAVRSLSAFIYMLGSRVRAVYGAAAGTVAGSDAAAVPLALARMAAVPGWPKSAEAFRHPEGGAAAALAALQRAAASLDASVHEGLGHSRRLSSALPAFTAVIRAGTARGRAAPAHRVRRSRSVPSWALYGLQYGVAMGVALALMAVPAVASTALRGRVVDLVATVAMTWMPTVGDATRRAFNRILGTALAAAWAYATIGLAYLASGLTWDDTVAKWVVIVVLVAVWGAFCALNSLRYPKVQYAWVVAALTVPLVAMPALRAPAPPWEDVGWRLINVAMGVAIVWATALALAPLSAHRVAAAAADTALQNLAGLVRQLPLHLEDAAAAAAEVKGQEGDLEAGGGGRPGPGPPAAGNAALRLSYFSEAHLVPVTMSFRVTRALGDLLAAIPALEAERLPLRRAPAPPPGAAAAAAHAVQVLLDIIDITFALKMENGPAGAWHIPPTQRAWMGEVTTAVAAALDDLRGAIHGAEGALEAVLGHVAAADRALAAQTKEALAEAEGTAGGGGGGKLPMEVAVLNYLGYYALQQLKTVACAVVRAFCQSAAVRSATAADAAAGLAALAETALPEGRLGPEYAIARLLEGSSRPERTDSVELAALREAVALQAERSGSGDAAEGRRSADGAPHD